ncbi:membrane protein [soil metagenome]
MRAIWRFIGSAPLTFSWLMLLLFTTGIQHTVTGRQRHHLLLHGSTNLHHLAGDPIQVLFASLLWIDGYRWWPYLLLFCLFLAPAERWLGQFRWLATGLIAHIVATYVSEGFLYLQIQDALATPALINARDIGVSYFMVGMIGVLTYHVIRPWRWLYLGLAVLAVGTALLVNPGFTPLGHFCALLVGLACYPLTRGRDRPALDPVRKLRTCGSHRRGRRTPDALRATGPAGAGER